MKYNKAVFAFILAREATGRREPGNTADNSRKTLAGDPGFKQASAQARVRIRKLQLWYVEEADPLRQALLEIYLAVVLKTSYNDFDTH